MKSDDALAGLIEDARHVSEVELAVRVVCGELVEMGEQRRGLEGVQAHVDFAKRQLVGCEHFLLDDVGNFRRAGLGMDDAAVAGRLAGLGGGEGHGARFGPGGRSPARRAFRTG